jgi:hypothetical protein
MIHTIQQKLTFLGTSSPKLQSWHVSWPFTDLELSYFRVESFRYWDQSANEAQLACSPAPDSCFCREFQRNPHRSSPSPPPELMPSIYFCLFKVSGERYYFDRFE